MVGGVSPRPFVAWELSNTVIFSYKYRTKKLAFLPCPCPARVRSVRISTHRRLFFLNKFSARAGHVSAHPPSPSPGTKAQEKKRNGLQQRKADRGHDESRPKKRIHVAPVVHVVLLLIGIHRIVGEHGEDKGDDGDGRRCHDYCLRLYR